MDFNTRIRRRSIIGTVPLTGIIRRVSELGGIIILYLSITLMGPLLRLVWESYEAHKKPMDDKVVYPQLNAGTSTMFDSSRVLYKCTT